MKPKIFFSFILFTVIFSACKKDNNAGNECFSNAVTVRIITNASATVKGSGDQFYIVEDGSIDSRLNPCTLAKEFQVNNLKVNISGEVKMTIQGGPGPCCTENFVITKISK